MIIVALHADVELVGFSAEQIFNCELRRQMHLVEAFALRLSSPLPPEADPLLPNEERFNLIDTLLLSWSQKYINPKP